MTEDEYKKIRKIILDKSLEIMRAEGLHQLDVKNRIKMMLPDLRRTPKAAAQNVREHLQHKLMTSEFEDYNDYNKCCLLFMFCVRPPKEFIEKMNGQLLVDLNGYIKDINIQGQKRHQVVQKPSMHQRKKTKTASMNLRSGKLAKTLNEDERKNKGNSRISMSLEDLYHSEVPSPGSRPGRPVQLTPSPDLPMEITQSDSREKEKKQNIGVNVGRLDENKDKATVEEPEEKNGNNQEKRLKKQLARKSLSDSRNMDCHPGKPGLEICEPPVGHLTSFFNPTPIVQLERHLVLHQFCKFYRSMFRDPECNILGELTAKAINHIHIKISNTEVGRLLNHLLLEIFDLFEKSHKVLRDKSVEHETIIH